MGGENEGFLSCIKIWSNGTWVYYKMTVVLSAREFGVNSEVKVNRVLAFVTFVVLGVDVVIAISDRKK